MARSVVLLLMLTSVSVILLMLAQNTFGQDLLELSSVVVAVVLDAVVFDIVSN